MLAHLLPWAVGHSQGQGNAAALSLVEGDAEIRHLLQGLRRHVRAAVAHCFFLPWPPLHTARGSASLPGKTAPSVRIRAMLLCVRRTCDAA